MPSINLEMMKQLLEEFSEKEALTTEEINVIEKEISNLEERINICRSKLQNLGSDKEKLAAMKERYVQGNFKQYIQGSIPALSDTAKGPVTPTDTPARRTAAGIKSLSTGAISHPDLITSSQIPTNLEEQVLQANVSEPAGETHSVAPIGAEVVGQTLPPPVSASEGEPALSDDENDGTQEGGEPIKSINEALKGLFRK